MLITVKALSCRGSKCSKCLNEANKRSLIRRQAVEPRGPDRKTVDGRRVARHRRLTERRRRRRAAQVATRLWLCEARRVRKYSAPGKVSRNLPRLVRAAHSVNVNRNNAGRLPARRFQRGLIECSAARAQSGEQLRANNIDRVDAFAQRNKFVPVPQRAVVYAREQRQVKWQAGHWSVQKRPVFHTGRLVGNRRFA